MFELPCFPSTPIRGTQILQMRSLRMYINGNSERLSPSSTDFALPLFAFHTFSPLHSYMTFHLSQLTGDAVLLSTANATAMADGLLRMAHCLIIELPKPQLQDLCYTLDLLLMRVDQILDAEDLSLNFDGLTTNPGESFRLCPDPPSPVLSPRPSPPPAGQRLWRDTGSTSVSTTSDTYGLTPTSSPSYRHQKLPVPTWAPTPNPDSLATDPAKSHTLCLNFPLPHLPPQTSTATCRPKTLARF